MSGGENFFAIIKARMKARKSCCFKESDTQVMRVTRQLVDERMYRRYISFIFRTVRKFSASRFVNYDCHQNVEYICK